VTAGLKNKIAFTLRETINWCSRSWTTRVRCCIRRERSNNNGLTTTNTCRVESWWTASLATTLRNEEEWKGMWLEMEPILPWTTSKTISISTLSKSQ